MMLAGDGQQVSVPPGFRFHPTDEELLYYYLRKKVSYEAIDLDVIREVDLNKLEPWDLKDKCRIGSGGQNEWYFFSHKDKKYPTGSRTNRATRAGFWKATGRDKAIHHHHLNNGSCSWNSKRIIGMRKTLVFYTGRAPHGQKTDWIMHEYRLDDDDHHRHFNNTPTNYASSSSKTPVPEVQEDGWVVCRVFKKKNHQNRSQVVVQPKDEGEDDDHIQMMNKLMASVSAAADQPKQAQAAGVFPHNYSSNTASSMFDHGSSNYNIHLPQLQTSPHDQNITSLFSSDQGVLLAQDHTNSDWSFLDKLLASHHQQQQHTTHQTKFNHLLLQHSSSATATPPPPLPSSHDVFSFHHFGHQN